MKDKVFIYMIQYSKEDFIYIGSTVNIKERFKIQKKHGTRIKDQEILNKNKLKLTILEIADRGKRYELEGFYMDLFKSWGFKLKNKYMIFNRSRKEFFYNKKSKKNNSI